MTAIAAQDRLTPVGIFLHATPMLELIMAGLLLASLAAAAVCVRKLATGPRLTGGSAYLSNLRIGGPVVGLLGAAWAGLGMALGLANVTGQVPLKVLAHGYSEVMLVVLLGFLAGAVGVIANWAVESRIDRAVLRA